MLSNQVTVIGSANDYPHWADPSLINPNENVLKVIQSCVHNSGSDYYGLNANPSYRWIFLKEDLSSKNSLGKIDAVLGHGSMFEGEIQGHRYIFFIDGVEINGGLSISAAYHLDSGADNGNEKT